MNNTLALGVFAALVYFRDLDWQFSAGESSTGRILGPFSLVLIIITIIFPAEVTVILLVEFAVGIVAIVSGFGFKHTYFVSAFHRDFFFFLQKSF